MNKSTRQLYRDKKVLLLGGLGFIGTNLVQLLLQQGAQITIVDNFLSDHGANWFHLEPIREQVDFHLGDIRSAETMNELVKGQDIVFNIAAQTSHSDSMREPFLDLDINARGNLTVLEACRQHNPQARIVFVGTRAFYGTPAALPVTETASLNPQDIYAVNRLAAEQYHWVYHQHYDLPVVSMRLGNLYGPCGQMKHPRYNVLNYFMRMALEKRCIQIYGSGQQQRDYVYITDACQALVLAGIDEQAIGQTYNVGAGVAYGFLELVEWIIAAAGSGSYQQVDWPAGSKVFDVGDFIMGIDKIQAELGWQPETDIQSGIQQSLNYYRQYQQYYW